MLIAGVVIDVKPELAADAAAALHHCPGVTQVQGPVSPGRLVAVVEAPATAEMDHLVEQILGLEGIISVNPAYIHFDAYPGGDTAHV